MATDLWQIRRKKRYSLDELSKRCGIHPGLIKAYELGERTIPLADLEKLALALEVESWDIKELSDPPPRNSSRSQPQEPQEQQEQQEQQQPPDDVRGQSRYDSSPSYSRYANDISQPYGSSRPGSGSSERRSHGSDRERQGGSRYDSGSGSYDRRPTYNNRGRSPSRSSRSGYRDRRSQPRKKSPRRQKAAPARATQIEHLKKLLVRLDMSGDDFMRLAGKPLSLLTRKEAAHLLTTCQDLLATRKPPKPKGKRQRPYLPESVDEHELVYLTQVQMDKRNLKLTLFNGEPMEGTLLGFSPYALTLATPEGPEVTVQKLAVAYYAVDPAPAVEEDEEDGESA
ncbi:MAG: helix-turn-helix transcriptional regulator [Chloroflexota bacterium]|nr:helix-turn-helix transcriptional regulator [Chloroflexota bacterium]